MDVWEKETKITKKYPFFSMFYIDQEIDIPWYIEELEKEIINFHNISRHALVQSISELIPCYLIIFIQIKHPE